MKEEGITMKRIVSLLLAVILVFSCCILTAFAQNSKISLGLQEKLNNCDPDDTVPVSITYAIKTQKLSDMPSWPGEAATAEYSEYCNSVQKEMQEQIFAGLDVNIRLEIMSWSVIADVKARDIETIAENDAVREIEYFENGTYEPSDEPEPESGEGYYLIGDMNDWKIDKDYKFQKFGSSTYRGIMFYGKDVQGDETFQIVYSADGKTVSDNHSVYPAKDRCYNENGEVFQYGAFQWYLLYFYPNGTTEDGGYGGYSADNYLYVTLCEPPEDDPEEGFLYRDKLLAYMSERSDYLFEYDDLEVYREVYYHHDQNGEIDWALIDAQTPYWLNDQWIYGIIGKRVISDCNSKYPFEAYMGIYDAKKDTFFDMLYVDLDQYDDLEEVYNEYGYDGWYGGLLGDLDKDNEISIIDATIIQRCDAMMQDYPQWDMIPYIYPEAYGDILYTDCYSDFNLDGERDILDATCIQRYLVGLTFPIG